MNRSITSLFYAKFYIEICGFWNTMFFAERLTSYFYGSSFFIRPWYFSSFSYRFSLKLLSPYICYHCCLLFLLHNHVKRAPFLQPTRAVVFYAWRDELVQRSGETELRSWPALFLQPAGALFWPWGERGTELGRHLILHKLNDIGDCLMITTGNAVIVAVEQSSHVSVSINYGFTQQLKFWSQFWL